MSVYARPDSPAASRQASLATIPGSEPGFQMGDMILPLTIEFVYMEISYGAPTRSSGAEPHALGMPKLHSHLSKRCVDMGIAKPLVIGDADYRDETSVDIQHGVTVHPAALSAFTTYGPTSTAIVVQWTNDRGPTRWMAGREARGEDHRNINKSGHAISSRPTRVATLLACTSREDVSQMSDSTLSEGTRRTRRK